MRRRVGACVCQKCRGHPVSITQLSRYFATRRAQLQSKWSPARMIAGRCGGNRGGGGNTTVDGGKKYSRYVRTATKGSLPWQANSQQEARGNLPSKNRQVEQPVSTLEKSTCPSIQKWRGRRPGSRVAVYLARWARVNRRARDPAT
jgi:hypothetical protein